MCLQAFSGGFLDHSEHFETLQLSLFHSDVFIRTELQKLYNY